MWIRSQDKLKIVDVIVVYIAKYDNVFRIESYEASHKDEEDWWYLGRYSTKEKALKVLDMIEDAIIRDNSIPFNMPDDDEVIV